ncbi:CDP-archaeol synthase [Candidatus Gottesmanbacteria bacterium]|nr:CDP-archaeol synthase [Candidatus Gottesmanbacteria bacterium]
MDYITFIIACIYFYLPAAMANIGANLGKFIPWFRNRKQPIDFGMTIYGVRVVGDHKNIGSFLFGVIFGSLFGMLKTLVFDRSMEPYLLLHESAVSLILLYVFMSVAALCGDIIKSIIKRLCHVSPHAPFIPFDEIDHSLTSMLVAKLFFPIPWSAVVLIVCVFLFFHLVANVIGYRLKIKDVPY